MQMPCKQCGTSFEITDDDLKFYEKVSPVFNGKKELIPPPTLCPDCRKQRRFTWRNERFLHHRKCDLTGETVISFYRPDAPFKVYDKDAWWSDRWDPMSFGREIDFTKPFFEQLAELRRVVPRLGMVITQDEGSAYSSYCVSTKNCYMCSSCVVNEDSYYCYQANESKNCVDCNSVTRCELCSECIHCYSLFSSVSCKDCENGSGLLFCEDCRGCSDCIGCKNLVNKKNCILNRQATLEEVAALRQDLASHAKRCAFEEKFRALALSLPTRAAHLTQCENCTGDHLRQCRNTFDCFDAINLEDCRFVFPAPGLGMKDCRDCHYSPGSELVYDSVSGLRCARARFVLHSWDCEDIAYTDECFSSKNLFGCIGLRHKQYCILNKQYSKEEYEKLVPQIIGHMRKSPLRSFGTTAGQAGEWGEFCPIRDSLFAYNESIAQNEFPLSQKQILKNGWKWVDIRSETQQVSRSIPAKQLPDTIDDVPDPSAVALAKADDIVNWAIECEATKRPFRIIRQELDFYRKMKLPIPHFHPDERHKRRMALRNPRKLWRRNCMKCQKPMETTYAPERPEIVYCESCYLAEVY